MQWVLEGGRVLRRLLRRGSKKGLLRRHLEGRNTPFRDYDHPLRVRPTIPPRTKNHSRSKFSSCFEKSFSLEIAIPSLVFCSQRGAWSEKAILDLEAESLLISPPFQTKHQSRYDRGNDSSDWHSQLQ